MVEKNDALFFLDEIVGAGHPDKTLS